MGQRIAPCPAQFLNVLEQRLARLALGVARDAVHDQPRGRGRAGSDQLGVEGYRYGIGEVIVFGISLLTGGSG